MNRRIPNGTYGGVEGGLTTRLSDCQKASSIKHDPVLHEGIIRVAFGNRIIICYHNTVDLRLARKGIVVFQSFFSEKGVSQREAATPLRHLSTGCFTGECKYGKLMKSYESYTNL